VTDAPGHLDLDALADVLAGEHDDPHLRSCTTCGDRLAELAAAQAPVTRGLTALPPPPLPDGLSARLARALQDERRRELATVTPLRRRAPSWLPAAAASAVLVMAGAVGWSLLDQPGPESAGVASDAGGGGGEDQGQPAAPEMATGLAAGPTDWADEASRTAALPGLLAQAGDSANSSRAAPATEAALERLRDPAALAGCLAGLPRGGEDVLAVDYGQYAGAPAVAVVQPADPGAVAVTVVGRGCSATDPDVLGELLLPRP
jgi:hypothetical protein